MKSQVKMQFLVKMLEMYWVMLDVIEHLSVNSAMLLSGKQNHKISYWKLCNAHMNFMWCITCVSFWVVGRSYGAIPIFVQLDRCESGWRPRSGTCWKYFDITFHTFSDNKLPWITFWRYWQGYEFLAGC